MRKREVVSGRSDSWMSAFYSGTRLGEVRGVCNPPQGALLSAPPIPNQLAHRCHHSCQVAFDQ